MELEFLDPVGCAVLLPAYGFDLRLDGPFEAVKGNFFVARPARDDIQQLHEHACPADKGDGDGKVEDNVESLLDNDEDGVKDEARVSNEK